MVGWHHQLDRHEFERAPGDGEGQGGLACCRPWGGKAERSSVTEQRQQMPLPPPEAAGAPVLEDGRGLVVTGCLWSLLSVAVRGLMRSCRTFWSTQGAEPVGGAAPWAFRAPSPERTPWPWAVFRQPLLELSMPFPPRLCP